jgi:hypothetical protein
MPQAWHLLFFMAKKSKQKKATTNQNFNHGFAAAYPTCSWLP